MASFIFECPQGHLLEAELSDVGGKCRCPQCGTSFVIPAAPSGEAPKIERVPPQDVVQSPVTVDDRLPNLLHIPCPAGHLLETPREMLNQPEVCPHCQQHFVPREKDSQEFQRRQRITEEARDKRLGRAWMKWSIVLIAVVLFGLLMLLLASR